MNTDETALVGGIVVWAVSLGLLVAHWPGLLVELAVAIRVQTLVFAGGVAGAVMLTVGLCAAVVRGLLAAGERMASSGPNNLTEVPWDE